jgi:hypothetical protein
MYEMKNNLLARFLKGKYTTSTINEKNKKNPPARHMFFKKSDEKLNFFMAFVFWFIFFTNHTQHYGDTI